MLKVDIDRKLLSVFRLAIVSLICEILGSIAYFITYSYSSENGGIYKIAACFPSFLNLFDLALGLAPIVLLVVYLVKYSKENKNPIIISVIFGLIALFPLLNVIFDVVMYGSNALSIIFSLAVSVSFIFATVSVLQGVKNIVPIIVAVSIGIVINALQMAILFTNLDTYIRANMYLYLFTNPLNAIGSITLLLALFLYIKINGVPAVIKSEQEKNMDTARVLRELLNDYEMGKITEEEYQGKRSEVINNL